jgi:hypothetical protein
MYVGENARRAPARWFACAHALHATPLERFDRRALYTAAIPHNDGVGGGASERGGVPSEASFASVGMASAPVRHRSAGADDGCTFFGKGREKGLAEGLAEVHILEGRKRRCVRCD